MRVLDALEKPAGSPAYFVSFSGERIGELLEVGTGKDYADIEAALDYVLTQTWASTTENAVTVTATAGSASVTGSGFLSLSADNYMQVGTDWWAIKSIESDGAMTLWHGAQETVADTLADYYVLNEFTIECFEHQNVVAKTLPVGVSIKLIGHTPNIQIIETASIVISYHMKLEITHCVLSLIDQSGLFVGGITLGRGIIDCHDFGVISNHDDAVLFTIAASAYTFERVTGSNFRSTISADYMKIDASNLNTYSVSDHWLLQLSITNTDYGHPIEITNYNSISNGPVVYGQSSGIEFNGGNANKVINISTSLLIAYHSTAAGPGGTNTQAQVLWTFGVGTFNITDTILDCINSDYEIYSRGATVNLTNTTRLDGSAVRQIAIP